MGASPWSRAKSKAKRGLRRPGLCGPFGLWHGNADSAIPGARLHLCPGEAHLLLWNHLQEVLLAAAGEPAAFGLTTKGLSTLPTLPATFETRTILKTEVR